MLMGYAWEGIELEEKFCTLGRANIALWQQRYGQLPGYGTATLLQGDSRQARAVLSGQSIECVVASPPYVSTLQDQRVSRGPGQTSSHDVRKSGERYTDAGASSLAGYGTSPCQLGALPPGTLDAVVSSPPYAGAGEVLGRHNGIDWSKTTGTGQRLTPGRGMLPYGQAPGQLGAMLPGSVDAVVSSPPYAESLQHDGAARIDLTHTKRDGDVSHQRHGAIDTGLQYGQTPGNLGNLAPGVMAEVIVSSPPYEYSINTSKQGARQPEREAALGRPIAYGSSPGQLGTTQGDTFWSAASSILAETVALLAPGGLTVWVVKSYIRAGKLVDFPGDWQRLCEFHGLTLVERIEASLIDHHGTQEGLFGEATEHTTAKKSFFRRLCEAKGSPAINAETVLILRKGTP